METQYSQIGGITPNALLDQLCLDLILKDFRKGIFYIEITGNLCARRSEVK